MLIRESNHQVNFDFLLATFDHEDHSQSQPPLPNKRTLRVILIWTKFGDPSLNSRHYHSPNLTLPVTAETCEHVEVQMDFRRSSGSRAGPESGKSESCEPENMGCKIAVTALGNLLANFPFWLSLCHFIPLSWHGCNESHISHLLPTMTSISGTNRGMPPEFTPGIGVEIKWQPFRRRYFQMHFLEWKCINSANDFNEVCSWGSN